MTIRELAEKSMINKTGERPLEYLFVWTKLAPLLILDKPTRNKIKILDVGGGESKLSKTLAELGFDVTVIDIADVIHGKAKFVKENILTYEFPEGTFDIIISISTVEHIGLSSYKQTKLDPDGDIKTMHKIYKWLKPNGIAIITLPFGKPHHPPSFERVYNNETLKTRILADKWEVLEENYICKKDRWATCSKEEALSRDATVLLMLMKC